MSGQHSHRSTPDYSPTDRFRTLDRLPTHVALLDGRGVIVEVNEAWRRFGIENGLADGGHGVGENYCELVVGALGPRHRLALDLQALLEGRSALLTWTYPCHGPDRKRWFNLIGVLLGASETARVALIHQEITALIPADAIGDGPPPEASRAALMPELHDLDAWRDREGSSPMPLLKGRAGEAPSDSARSLTPRQREVLALIGRGMTNGEIGAALSMAPNTVKAHTSTILKRLNLTSRTQAALSAERLLRAWRPPR